MPEPLDPFGGIAGIGGDYLIRIEHIVGHAGHAVSQGGIGAAQKAAVGIGPKFALHFMRKHAQVHAARSGAQQDAPALLIDEQVKSEGPDLAVIGTFQRSPKVSVHKAKAGARRGRHTHGHGPTAESVQNGKMQKDQPHAREVHRKVGLQLRLRARFADDQRNIVVSAEPLCNDGN